MFKFESIKKRYVIGKEEIQVLKGLDLEIEKGEFISILGSSGSGKSTFMNIAGLMDKYDSGSYKFFDREVKECTGAELAKMRNEHIGFVFQKYHLIETYSVLQNVMMPLLIRGESHKRAKSIAMKKIEMVELGDRIEHKPSELSGGQQQRVAIARAIVGEPSVLLADEPTGALDSKTGKEILRIFNLLNDEGVTILQITHDAEVAKYAKRIVNIKDGIFC